MSLCSDYCYMTKLSLGRHNSTHLPTPIPPDRKLMADQCLDTTKAQYGEPVSSTGVPYRTRYDSKTTLPPRPTPAWVISHRCWDLGQHTAWSADSSAGWHVLSGASVGLNCQQLLPGGWCGLELVTVFLAALLIS